MLYIQFQSSVAFVHVQYILHAFLRWFQPALYSAKPQRGGLCSGQQKLATALEFFQNNRSDSFGVKPPLY